MKVVQTGTRSRDSLGLSAAVCPGRRECGRVQRTKLGFSVAYLYGKPPFYGEVSRDGVSLNLRHVDGPVMDQSLKEKEILLSANIPVHGVKALFLEFKERGVEFAQMLKAQPWGATDFVVRDIDGNLLCFAGAADGGA